jgi:phenylacetate-CoA ligase
LQQAQFRQLKNLLDYAAAHSPFYRQRLAGFDTGRLSTDSFRCIPLLTRAELQAHGRQLDCLTVPDDHLPMREIKTSGSTAQPVEVRDTAIGSLLWSAITLRDHHWHGRDFSASLAAIRWRSDDRAMAPEGLRQADWGAPVNLLHATGPGYFLNIASDVKAQLGWWLAVDPVYLLTHPSNLRALLNLLAESAARPANLRQLRCVGEVVSDALRHQVKSLLGVPLIDMYTCQELGYMALQCPQHSHYHVQSEHVILEVLRDDGSPCGPGDTGRVVVTSLHNFATPLIRYAIGDYAVPGGPCPCGRGLPVLRSIVGRSRNMVRRPDGSLIWPNIGFGEFSRVAPIRQFQVVQHSLQDIELRLVSAVALTVEQEARIGAILARHLGSGFKVRISYHEQIPRSAGGKYEDVLSLL